MRINTSILTYLKRPTTIILPFLSIIFLLSELTKSLNLITNLAPNLYIAPNDKVGFKVRNFINGSQIESQVFPQPMIGEELEDKFVIISTDLEGCGELHQVYPLQIAALCGETAPELKMFRYLPKSESPTAAKTYVYKPAVSTVLCKDFYVIDYFFFVACEMTATGNNNLVVKVVQLEFTPTTKAYAFKELASLQKDGFYRRAGEAIKIECVEVDDYNVRCLAHQKKKKVGAAVPGGAIVFDFNMKDKKLTSIVGTGGTSDYPTPFTNGVYKAKFATPDFFYKQDWKGDKIVPCRVNGGSINCQEGSAFNLGFDLMTRWLVKYAKKKEADTSSELKALYLLDSEKISKCVIKKIPFTKADLDCDGIKLNFNAESKKSLKVAGIFSSPNFNELIIPYLKIPSGEEKNEYIEGYLSIDIDHKTTDFNNISQSRSKRITFLNSTYYYRSATGTTQYLFRRKADSMLIKSPITKTSDDILITAFPSLSSVVWEEKAEKFFLKSKINRMKTPFSELGAAEIKKLDIYNKGFADFGFNNKIVDGNGANVKVTLQNHELPEVSHFWKKVETVALMGITDTDIRSLFVIRGFIQNRDPLFDEYTITRESHKAQVFIVIHDFTNSINILDCEVSLLSDTETDDEEIPDDMKWTNGKSVCKLKKTIPYKEGVLLKVEASDEELIMILSQTTKTSTEVWLRRYNENFELKGSLMISPYLSNCDAQIFSTYLYTICSYSRTEGPEVTGVKPEINTEGDYPKTGIIMKQIKVEKETLKELKTNFINPFLDGSPYFLKGETIFYAGTSSFAFVVNNHPKDLSILVVDFSKMNEGYDVVISNKLTVREELKTGKTGKQSYNIQICPTLSTLFIYSLQSSKMYGVNTDALERSYLEVPISTKSGEPTKLLGMQCSNLDESFQLWVQEKFSKKSVILTYYGFDGTQAVNKIHSQFEVTEKVNRFGMASVLQLSEGVLYTFLYDHSSIFYNQSYVVDLRGPVSMIDAHGLNPGGYDFDVELANLQQKKQRQIHVTVHSSELFSAFVLDAPKFPESGKIHKTKLSIFLDIEGVLTDILIDDEVKQYLRIEKPIEDLTDQNSYAIEDKHYHIESVGDSSLSRNEEETELYLFTGWKNKRLTINLANYGYKCDHFTIMNSKDNFFVGFTCAISFDLHYFLLKIDKKNPVKADKVGQVKVPFQVSFIKGMTHDSSVIVAIRELIGDKLIVYKFDISKTDLDNWESITLKWRIPGDNMAFSYCKFDVIAVGDVTGIIVLSPGKNSFDFLRLNFKANTVASSTTIHSKGKLPIYYLICQGKKDAKDEKKMYLRCVGGGVGIFFEEFRVDIDTESKEVRRTVQPTVLYTYKLPFLKRYDIAEVELMGDYILLNGHFGKKKVQDQNKVVKKSLTALVYKREQELLHCLAPFDAGITELIDHEGKTYLLSITGKQQVVADKKKISYRFSYQELMANNFEITIHNSDKFPNNKVPLKFIGLGDYPSNTISRRFYLFKQINPINFLIGFIGVLFTVFALYICFATYEFIKLKNQESLRRTFMIHQTKEVYKFDKKSQLISQQKENEPLISNDEEAGTSVKEDEKEPEVEPVAEPVVEVEEEPQQDGTPEEEMPQVEESEEVKLEEEEIAVEVEKEKEQEQETPDDAPKTQKEETLINEEEGEPMEEELIIDENPAEGEPETIIKPESEPQDLLSEDPVPDSEQTDPPTPEDDTPDIQQDDNPNPEIEE